MMVTVVRTILVTVLALQAVVRPAALEPELFDGDQCTTKSGEAGICRRADECRWLRLALKRHEIKLADIVNCGFERYEPVVCCRMDEVPPRVSYVASKSTAACANYDGVQSRLSFHIIDGSEAEGGEIPFIAALGYVDENGDGLDDDRKYSWRCGSSLITARFLLTAAHCIRAKQRPVVARMGALNVVTPTDIDQHTLQDRTLTRFLLHPEFKTRKKYQDIGLIEVSKPFEFDDAVKPICLHGDVGDMPAGVELLVAGWGRTENSTDSKFLLKANVTTMSLDNCKVEFSKQGDFPDKLPNGVIESQYCAVGIQRSGSPYWTDACKGDSGGPLYYISSDQKYYLIGITSFGYHCGEVANVPGIYTRVAYYLRWVEEIAWAT